MHILTWLDSMIAMWLLLCTYWFMMLLLCAVDISCWNEVVVDILPLEDAVSNEGYWIAHVVLLFED